MKMNTVFLPIRSITVVAVFLASCLSQMAQSENGSDSIHISTDFLKELDNAFGFQNEKPQIAPFNTIEPVQLDTELLHLWVKDPNAKSIATVSKYPYIVNIPGLTDGGFAKGIVKHRKRICCFWVRRQRISLTIFDQGRTNVAQIKGFIRILQRHHGQVLPHQRKRPLLQRRFTGVSE